MTYPEPVNPQSELDVAEVLRRRRQQMHDDIDAQFESMAIELGVQLDLTPKHSIGISFEPGVTLSYTPELTEETAAGFYTLRTGTREVEVLRSLSPQPGKVYFEMADSQGQLQAYCVDEPLFNVLFRKLVRPRLTLGQRLASQRPVSYGVDPQNKAVALRYNADGSVDRGYFDGEGKFVPDA